jgi:murein DD-endopeptidase MepM/ murein hydrolase activator NlpD
MQKGSPGMHDLLHGGERSRSKKVLVCLVSLHLCISPFGLMGEPSALPEPDNLNIRIIGTACFQGRWSAFIEDVNTLSDSFYDVGDPIYGYKISAIATTGISLEKGTKKYFVPIKSSSAPALPEPEPRAMAENMYLPSSALPSVTPNFYVDSGKPTQWDYYIPLSEIPAQSKTGLKLTEPAREAAALKQTSRAGRFFFPLASYKRLSSKFGYRKHPIGGGTKMHNGLDLSAKSGTKIFAADAGTVTSSGWRGGYGYCVVIDHHNGYTTTYGHCSKLIADTGDNVRRGEYIANVGSTGASTGPHLHFEVRKEKKPIDPMPFFKGVL